MKGGATELAGYAILCALRGVCSVVNAVNLVRKKKDGGLQE